MDVSHVCCANGFRFSSHPGTSRFHSNDCLHVAIRAVSFSLLFSKLSILLLYELGLTTARANILAGTFLAITRQPLELESCSNPLRIQQVF